MLCVCMLFVRVLYTSFNHWIGNYCTCTLFTRHGSWTRSRGIAARDLFRRCCVHDPLEGLRLVYGCARVCTLAGCLRTFVFMVAGSSGLQVDDIDIVGCCSAPCVLVRGANATISLTFTPGAPALRANCQLKTIISMIL